MDVATLTVSSSGPAAAWWPKYMGKYRKVEGVTSRERPVWRNWEAGAYFFYDSFGQWVLGPDYKEDRGGITSEEKGLTEIPLRGWRYYDGGWKSDPELTVIGRWRAGGGGIRELVTLSSVLTGLYLQEATEPSPGSSWARVSEYS